MEALWQELQPSAGQPRGPSSHSASPGHLQLVPLGGVRPRQAHVIGPRLWHQGLGWTGRDGPQRSVPILRIIFTDHHKGQHLEQCSPLECSARQGLSLCYRGHHGSDSSCLFSQEMTYSISGFSGSQNVFGIHWWCWWLRSASPPPPAVHGCGAGPEDTRWGLCWMKLPFTLMCEDSCKHMFSLLLGKQSGISGECLSSVSEAARPLCGGRLRSSSEARVPLLHAPHTGGFCGFPAPPVGLQRRLQLLPS